MNSRLFILSSWTQYVDDLRRVTDDESMREMIQVAEKHRGVEVYAMHGDNDPIAFPSELHPASSKQTQPKTPTPSSKAAANTENDHINSYEWEDSRPDSPIPINDLIPDFSSDSDTADPSYNPQVDKGKGVSSQPFFGEVCTDDSGEEDMLHAEFDGGADIGEEDYAFKEAEEEYEKDTEEILNEDLQGGRTIIMGRGSRGGRGRGGVAANAGRGRGSDVAGSSRGVSSGNRGVGRGRGSTRGVFIASDGTAMTSTQANQRITRSAMGWFQCSQESQRSTLHQPTQ
uniref:Uncharacterized protein n=1 Tax=Chenopodium quinoa TaxID=63459 RepID=A0A803MI90_CHEQI